MLKLSSHTTIKTKDFIFFTSKEKNYFNLKDKYIMNNNIKLIKLQVENSIPIHKKQQVKCTIQGDKFLDILYLEKQSTVGAIKLNKKEYLVKSTGEIKEYQYSEKKQVKNLKKTFKELKYLIRTNFSEISSNQLFLTLTYRENMQDEKRLYSDFNKFMKKLKYKYTQHQFEYITVAEPQGRGAWHLHVMLKTNLKILYIDNKIITSLWEHGFTKTEKLKSDDVGSYYVAYFTDLTIEDNNASSEEKSKKRQKGERLKFYPKNFKFYRCSRGIKKPKIEFREYQAIRKEYGNPTYIKTYSLNEVDDKDNIVKRINLIQYESYKKDFL